MRRSMILFLALVAAFVVGSGSVAMADIPDSGGTISGCYLKRGNAPLPKGNLRVINAEDGAECRRGETFLAWQALAISDRAVKEAWGPIDPGSVLAGVDSLPITSWIYSADADGIRHLGPTAQDFSKTFGVGSNHSISAVDASGVSFAAIKGLNARVRTQQMQITLLAVLTALSLGIAVWAVRTLRSVTQAARA